MNEVGGPAGPEGEILLGIGWSRGRVGDVDIRSTRPLHASRLFTKRVPRQALPLVPLLYALCGTAQARAAVSACERAMGLAEPVRVAAARDLLVLFETAREHLWRFSLDWPRLHGGAASGAPVAAASTLMEAFRTALWGRTDPFLPGALPLENGGGSAREVAGRLRALLARELFDLEPEGFQEIRDADALDAWARGRGGGAALIPWINDRGWGGLVPSAVAPLPALDETELRRLIEGPGGEEFLAFPLWSGNPRETGPYTRNASQPLVACLDRAGSGLAARLAARLVELAEIPGRLLSGLRRMEGGAESTPPGARPAAGVGVAQVEAARGRLVHYVRIAGDVVDEFRVLAPTEWNFHPRGVLARSLAGLRGGDRVSLETRVRIIVTAIDPCVGYRMEIR